MRSRLVLLAFLAALALSAPHGGARADGGAQLAEEDDFDHDHDRAQELLEQGEIMPLGEIIASVARAQPGEVVGVSLSRKSGRWVYHFKILTPEGRLVELSVDAESMDVIGQGAGGGSGD